MGRRGLRGWSAGENGVRGGLEVGEEASGEGVKVLMADAHAVPDESDVGRRHELCGRGEVGMAPDGEIQEVEELFEAQQREVHEGDVALKVYAVIHVDEMEKAVQPIGQER